MVENDAPHRAPKMSLRERKYWGTLAACAVLGGIIGFAMAFTGMLDGKDPTAMLYSNAALPRNLALVIAALWGVGLPLGCLFYHRYADEQDQHAYLWACTMGWYVFVVLTPTWWVLGRGGLTPPVDIGVIFLVSMVVNALVWLWKRYV